MIALLQRVNYARVLIEGINVAEAGYGLLVFAGLEKGDDEAVADRLLKKILAYRLFPDEAGQMNLGLRDINADLLLVSQFTLAADTGQGLRPGFSSAMPPDSARSLYDYLVASARAQHGKVATGEFGADMKVQLENDGPVTFWLRT